MGSAIAALAFVCAQTLPDMAPYVNISSVAQVPLTVYLVSMEAPATIKQISVTARIHTLVLTADKCRRA